MLPLPSLLVHRLRHSFTCRRHMSYLNPFLSKGQLKQAHKSFKHLRLHLACRADTLSQEQNGTSNSKAQRINICNRLCCVSGGDGCTRRLCEKFRKRTLYMRVRARVFIVHVFFKLVFTTLLQPLNAGTNLKYSRIVIEVCG